MAESVDAADSKSAAARREGSSPSLGTKQALDYLTRKPQRKVRALYAVYSYQHAAAILANPFPSELAEIGMASLCAPPWQRQG